jgi:enoyl-CoA hydratase
MPFLVNQKPGLASLLASGCTQRLARVIGSTQKPRKSFSLVETSRRRGKRNRLVSAVHPIEDLMVEALKMANRIASQAPIAIRNIKKAVNEGLESADRRRHSA